MWKAAELAGIVRRAETLGVLLAGIKELADLAFHESCRSFEQGWSGRLANGQFPRMDRRRNG